MWRALLLLIISSSAWGQTQETIILNEGELEIPITRFEAFADDAPILLWLPSARGISNKQSITATALGDSDIETWIIDLHLAYFVDAGRSSVKEFNPADIAKLIIIAAKRTNNKIYLMATGRVAKLSLEAIALVQQQAEKNNNDLRVGGLILFHPFLTLPTSTPGTRAQFLPIAQNSTIPIYYIQPSISTRQWRSREAIDMLQANGSAVFYHAMPGIAAGYHLRPDEDMSDLDFAQRAKLPTDIKNAIDLLSSQNDFSAPKVVEPISFTTVNKLYGLNPLSKRAALPLTLDDATASPVTIDYSSQKVTLVSFWASWCGPCIKELPSLRHLYDDYHDKGLQIVTVNVGETPTDVQKTIQEFSMQDYINLFDPQGSEMKTWNVYGFPTNFLINAKGELPFASFGGVEWDDKQVRDIIDSLLALE